MGVQTQKCIKNFPIEEAERILSGGDGSLESNASTMAAFHKAWERFNLNKSNWDEQTLIVITIHTFHSFFILVVPSFHCPLTLRRAPPSPTR